MQVRLANLRGALRLARGVVAGFGGPEARRPPPARQLALLQQLAALLDHVAQDLSGCHVLLGGSTGVDAAGTLWLDVDEPDGWAAACPPAACLPVLGAPVSHAQARRRRPCCAASTRPVSHYPLLATHRPPPSTHLDTHLDTLPAPRSWLDFLDGVDAAFVQRRRATVAALRRLEQSVAGAAGLAQVFCAAGAALDPGYRAFLEALARHAAGGAGPAAGGALGEVSLLVGPPARALGAAADVAAAAAGVLPGSAVDLEQGCLTVPVDAAPAEVYAFAAARGPAATEGLRGVRAREAEAAAAAAAARASLRLRHLVRGEGVSAERFRQCCRELHANSPALLPLLEGLSVCVAERNGVWLERGMLLLAWDFEL